MQELSEMILSDQQADGSFLSYSVPKGSQFGTGAVVYRTTFVAAIIAGALAEVPGREAQQVRERVADFLLTQAGPQGSFNYWAREAEETKLRPYPDDWDDTSCAVIALTLVRPAAVTGEMLGSLVTMLTNTEMGEGGPYRTWIVSEDAPKHWHDVDVAVNANIAYMLKLHGVDLPNLEQLIAARMAAGPLTSPYYPSPYPVEYFASRWYRGEQTERLRARILARRRDGRWGNPLDTALAVNALLNLGTAPKRLTAAAEWLRALRGKQILPQAFCIDPAVEGQSYVAGSGALTAAIALEAVARYDAAMRAAEAQPAAAASRDLQAEVIHAAVVNAAMTRLGQPGAELERAARRLHDRLLGGPAAGQITLLPYRFRQALGDAGRVVTDERVVALGVVSFCGWVAYTIYDDFLDDEGDPTLLSLANIALRELVLALEREAARSPGFEALVWATLDRQEAANAWEVSLCRVARQTDLLRLPVPDFGDRRALAERSMGHSLGALAIMIELGYAAGSAEVQGVQEFFHHFLIARQLSDDIHDWKADLRKGQINAVGAHVLANARRARSVRQLYTLLEQAFWEHSLPEVNGWIADELAQARAALKTIEPIQRPGVLEDLLVPIEASMHKALQQQQQTMEFLRTYRPGEAA